MRWKLTTLWLPHMKNEMFDKLVSSSKFMRRELQQLYRSFKVCSWDARIGVCVYVYVYVYVCVCVCMYIYVCVLVRFPNMFISSEFHALILLCASREAVFSLSLSLFFFSISFTHTHTHTTHSPSLPPSLELRSGFKSHSNIFLDLHKHIHSLHFIRRAVLLGSSIRRHLPKCMPSLMAALWKTCASTQVCYRALPQRMEWPSEINTEQW